MRNDIQAAEVVRALLDDSRFQFVQNGNYLRKGVCPSCGQKQLFISCAAPWQVKCSREGNCGYEETTRELLPELFTKFSEKYAPTEEDPCRTANAVLGIDRQFDLSKIGDWFEQNWYAPLKCHTIRFYMDEAKSRYWERLIDKTKENGQKNNIGGKRKPDNTLYRGDAWFPPTLELEENDRCFLVEGIFHSIGLFHKDYKAAAGYSSNNFPENFIKKHQGKNITWVLGLDGDKAGRKYTRKHARKLKAMGEKFEVLILPDNGKDWDDYYRLGKLDNKLISEARYQGKLFMAGNVEEKAYHMYCHRRYMSFTVSFRQAMYAISIDPEIDSDLQPSQDQKIDLESRDGWNVFIRHCNVDQISNTHPELLYMERDPIMDEQRYVFEIAYANGSPSDIIALEGTHLTAPDAFHKAMLNKSRGGTFDGDSKQLKRLRDRWLGSSMKMVQSIPFVGYDKDSKTYIFQDNAYNAGREVSLNRYGYFEIKKLGIKTSLRGVRIHTKGEFDPTWMQKYIQAFHWQGVSLLAFWLGSLFVQQIRAKHKTYPFLELTGDPGAGKSTVLEFCWKLVGRDDWEGFDVMKATIAGRRRAFSQVSNLPVVLIESDRDDGTPGAKAKQFGFDECKPFFNGRGTGTLGVARRNNDVEEHLFQASLVISQNAEVDGSEALLQRIVHCHCDKKHHRPNSREIARWFERQKVNDVCGFLVAALKNEDAILEAYGKAFVKYENRFSQNPHIRNERIAKNHAQVAACGHALRILFPANQFGEREEESLAQYLEDRAVGREHRLSADHPLVEQFWETLYYLENRGDRDIDSLNHSTDENHIAINLNHFAEKCRYYNQELLESKTLKKLLPHSKRHKLLGKNEVVMSKVTRKSIRCWVFQK